MSGARLGEDACSRNSEIGYRPRTKTWGAGFPKVDGFISHQIDAGLMIGVRREMGCRFADVEITAVLTACIANLAPALAAGYALHVSVLHGRKTGPVTMTGRVFPEMAPFTLKDVTSF